VRIKGVSERGEAPLTKNSFPLSFEGEGDTGQRLFEG